jgi:NADPH-dependent 2,4-dienoyl-CoA reductase/sulfur reductase-like enzyme
MRELAWPGGLVLTAGGEGVDARIVDEHVVVVGSGPAGLAAAWAIRRAGVDPLVGTRQTRWLHPGGTAMTISG